MNCIVCLKEMEKATAKHLNGLMKLYTGKGWICPNCLTRISNQVFQSTVNKPPQKSYPLTRS